CHFGEASVPVSRLVRTLAPPKRTTTRFSLSPSDGERVRVRGFRSCRGGPLSGSHCPLSVRLLQQLRQWLLNRRRPDFVALLVRMKEVRHDLAGQRAVGSQKFSADVEVVNVCAVV